MRFQRHQALGAAISSVVSQGFYALTQMLLSLRMLKIPANRDIYIKLIAFLIINLISGYLSHLIPGWVPGLMFLAISCAGSAILLGLIKVSEIKAVLTK